MSQIQNKLVIYEFLRKFFKVKRASDKEISPWSCFLKCHRVPLLKYSKLHDAWIILVLLVLFEKLSFTLSFPLMIEIDSIFFSPYPSFIHSRDLCWFSTSIRQWGFSNKPSDWRTTSLKQILVARSASEEVNGDIGGSKRWW